MPKQSLVLYSTLCGRDVLRYGKLKNDATLARELGIKPNTVSMWRKREIFDYKLLITYCEQRNIPIGFIITGQINTKYTDIDGQKVLTASDEPGLYKKDEGYTAVKEAIKTGEYITKIGMNTLQYPSELESVVDSFMAVMTSEDEDTKGSLARNVFTFHRTVTNERKIKQLEKEILELRTDMDAIKKQLFKIAQTDFKTAGLEREKKQAGGNGE